MQTSESTLPKKRWALALPFERAVLAMRQAKHRDRVLVAFARGAASHLSGVKGYALNNTQLFEIFSLGREGLLIPPTTIKITAAISPEIATCITQRVPYVGPTPTEELWQSLCAPSVLTPNGLAILPACVRDETILLLAGPLSQPIDGELQNALLKLCDVAGMALGRTMLVQKRTGTEPGDDDVQSAQDTAVLDQRKRRPLRARVAVNALTRHVQPPTTALSIDLDLAFVELVISESVHVPPYPAVATKINEIVRSGDFGLKDLAELIKSDQALSAEVLRHANSAVHGAGAVEVTSLDQAIGRVGARSLVGLALSVKLGAEARSAGPLLALKNKIWRQALASALICERLAARRELDGGEAFMCGLLHDFGSVIAVACIEKLLADATQQGVKVLDDEGDDASGLLHVLPSASWAEVVDGYHVELGRLVSERWSLPEVVNMAIVAHHRPELAGPHQAMVDLVVIADQVVELLESCSHVDIVTLARSAGLDEIDAEAVAGLLPAIPGLLGEISSGGADAAQAPSWVSDTASVLPGPLSAVDMPVLQRAGQSEHAFTACYISDDGLGISGSQALFQHGLVRIEVDGGKAGPYAGWMRVVSCREQDDGYLIELCPYALSASGIKQWQRFCEAAHKLAEAKASDP
jgi:HD-like signal output (HDOD) protein